MNEAVSIRSNAIEKGMNSFLSPSTYNHEKIVEMT